MKNVCRNIVAFGLFIFVFSIFSTGLRACCKVELLPEYVQTKIKVDKDYVDIGVITKGPLFPPCGSRQMLSVNFYVESLGKNRFTCKNDASALKDFKKFINHKNLSEKDRDSLSSMFSAIAHNSFIFLHTKLDKTDYYLRNLKPKQETTTDDSTFDV